MSEKLRQRGKDFAEFLGGLSEEQIAKGNMEEFRRVLEEHDRFKELYSSGTCYLCNKPLTSFSKKKPCMHWLLKPKGFKKKDIKAVAEQYGMLQIQSLLRWYANEKAFARNINDLVEEGTGSKIVELTIRYKNLEWSFSCAESDFLGHQNSQHSKHPHYHMQMRIDKRPFINFNDFHLPLSDMDVINITAMRERPDRIKTRNSFGEGMTDVFSDDSIEQVLDTAATEGDHELAPFSIDSFAEAEDGKEIQGEDLYQIVQEAKEKGVTIASLLHKLPNAKTQIIVSPGPGVVEQAPRTPKKKR